MIETKEERRLWGEMSRKRLKENGDDLATLCHRIKPVPCDQPPLLPILLDNSLSSHVKSSNVDSNQPDENKPTNIESTTTTSIKIRPNIDSYIINTIKLNQLLRNRITFDQVDSFFRRRGVSSDPGQNNTTPRVSKVRAQPPPRVAVVVENDQDARRLMHQFIVILCLHSGFNNASSIALNILVDVLDHFIESFCRLFKNLKQIHQFSLTEQTTTTTPGPLSFTNDFYSSQDFVQQALEESGVGSIKELKEFYVNDIVAYYRQTYKKVAKLYEEYKAKKRQRTASGSLASRFGTASGGRLTGDSSFSRLSGPLDPNDQAGTSNNDGSGGVGTGDDELPIDDFMSHNDFLNEESSSVLGEILTGLASTNFDEEMNKLLQMIGTDPFVPPQPGEFIAHPPPHSNDPHL